MPRQACRVPWVVCPEHGGALTSSGGQTRCRNCPRTWGYDRLGSVCAEPVVARVVDTDGVEIRMCAGHALDARHRLRGATIMPPGLNFLGCVSGNFHYLSEA